jgi:Uma2 family endonuclease
LAGEQAGEHAEEQEATMGKSALTHEPETYMARADYRA